MLASAMAEVLVDMHSNEPATSPMLLTMARHCGACLTMAYRD